MRLSLSRHDIDLIVESLEMKRKNLVNPSVVMINRLLSLREKLLHWRDQVWGKDELKEV